MEGEKHNESFRSMPYPTCGKCGDELSLKEKYKTFRGHKATCEHIYTEVWICNPCNSIAKVNEKRLDL